MPHNHPDYHAEIDRLRDKARQAGELLGALRPPEHLAPRHAEAKALQTRLYQTCLRNPSAALAGGYTAGKSLLTTLLLDLPGLLPVANVASTGNVTRIRITPGPGPSQVRRRAVTLLSPDTVAQLADFILGQLIAVAERNPAYDLRELRGHRLVNVADPAASDWTPLESLVGKIWADQIHNVQIRLWATELLAIRDALRIGGHLLPHSMPGTETAIDQASLDAAVLIGDSRVPPGSVDAGTAFRPPLMAAQLSTADGLRAMFPLVHEVVLDVELDERVWSFGGMPVDLLDFPGQSSGSMRDRFLAELELASATLLVVILDAEKPRNDDVHRLSSLLEKGRHARPELADSLIVVANRFDRLPPPAEPVTSVDGMAERSRDFRALRIEITELTRKRPDRAAFTSALATATRLGYFVPDARPADLDMVTTARQRWGDVVRGLTATPDPLVAALDGFASDGGLEHTRKLLATHLTTHGPRILCAEATAMSARLDGLLAVLCPPPPPRVTSVARLRMETLTGELDRAAERFRERLDQVRMLNGLEVNGHGLDEVLLDLAAEVVHDWNLWPPTLRLAANPDEVSLQSEKWYPDARAELDWLMGGPDEQPIERRGTGDGAATTTAPLLTRYRGSLDENVERAMTLLETALRQWSVALLAEPEFTAAAQRLGAPTGPETENRRLLRDWLAAVSGPQRAGLRLNQIDWLVFDPELLVRVATAVRAGRPGEPLPDPLAPNRALPWHPDILAHGTGGLGDFANPITVFRLRRDLVAALHRDLCRGLQEVLDRMSAQMRIFLDRFASDTLLNPEEMRRLNSPEDETGVAR